MSTSLSRNFGARLNLRSIPHPATSCRSSPAQTPPPESPYPQNTPSPNSACRTRLFRSVSAHLTAPTHYALLLGVHGIFLCCCFADAPNHKYDVDLFFIAADNALSQFL